MALCLYVSKKSLEAQLYALSAIQLQLKNSHEVTKESKDIFDKVKGENVDKLNTALVKIVDQKTSFFERKAIQRSIDDDMEKLTTKLILRSDRNFVRCQVPNEEILHAKKHAHIHKTAGAVMGTTAAFECYAICVTTFSVGMIFGIAVLGLGLWTSNELWKKGRYQEFFDHLSEEYKEDAYLFRLKDRADHIDPKSIISALLRHGFRSDGIAYLLNLLGEVLSDGKIKIKGKAKTQHELRELAKNIFAGVLDERLKEEAKKLDDRINAFRGNSVILKKGNTNLNYLLQEINPYMKICNYWYNYMNSLKDTLYIKEYSKIAQEHIDDAQEMPFQSRLEEMTNIARINLSIFDISNGGQDERERAVETIKELRDSMNCDQFFNARLDALEDFLWMISGFSTSDEPPAEEYPTTQIAKIVPNNCC
ncbi:hypothetical protein C1645_773881 [Glomus cerebriforme]|uniref:Uncharacterized protein n=1 Tax=Glomus cerebriforme TaxID=658196 RepID=A0A397ST05_9GLOM|nr:hypothetical protein C1645_773881 [Glomus cerebriforme]